MRRHFKTGTVPRAKHTWVMLILTLVLTGALSVPALAAVVPYQGYNYDYWNMSNPAPDAYIPVRSIGGRDVEVGAFKSPADMYVDKNENIYLLDTGNNRVVVFDKTLNLIKVISEFENGGQVDTFNNPNGLFVMEDLSIYIADTDNQRIVKLDADGNLLKIISEPKYETLQDDFKFLPTKICVDKAERVYAIVKNVFEGIMCFDTDGQFFGYFGTIKVRFSPIDMFWRTFATAEQKAKLKMFIPTEFTSMDIDDAGFIYATNLDTTNDNKVKRLNPKGEDVLINYTPQKIIGDQNFFPLGRLGGRSDFIDIVTRDSGIYTVLDRTRNRLYTYDSEGNLLYVIGGIGNVLGMTRKPIAVEKVGENLIVLDQNRNEIVYYEPTLYGSLINKAIALRYEGDEASAVVLWGEVLKLNSNFNLAYTGIGKSLLAAGDNKNAMFYLKKGMSVDYYAVAFKRYRNEVLKQSLSYVLTGVLVITAAIIVYFVRKSWKRRLQSKAL